MTAAEAVNHSWYMKPASEAQALEDGLQRIIRFWKRREIRSDEILEVSCLGGKWLSKPSASSKHSKWPLTLYRLQGLPGVVLSAPTALDAPGLKFRRKIPDATNSPYFGLDRHLNQKTTSSRKRLLDDLNESGSPFVTAQVSQQQKPIANIGAQRNKGLGRVMSVEGTDLFGTSPLKMNAHDRGGDVEIIDLTNHIPQLRADGDDFIPISHKRRVEKQFDFNVSSPNRPAESPTDRSNNHSLSGSKQKLLGTEARTPGAASKCSPGYTSTKALRKTVGKMKL